MYYNVKPKVGPGFEYINTNPELFRERRREVRLKWHKENEHPRGMLGKQHTEEKKAQIAKSGREAAKKRNYNPPRPVRQLSLGGEVVCEHESITDAAKAVSGVPSNIKYTIEGKFKKAYGYKWEYI